MDRRDFFKTMVITPLLGPFLHASKSGIDSELFLISDQPQTILPSLLEELGRWKSTSGRRFAFSNEHPKKKVLGHILESHGWKHVFPAHQSDLLLSFHPLQHSTPSSFTLVKSGQILDIRSRGLRSLWQEMNSDHASSSCLTVATLGPSTLSLSAGEAVRIYKDGRQVENLSLRKDRVVSFRAGRGSITVKIRGGKVWIPESSCLHKICCLTSPISYTGERIICAPNHFLAEILGPGMVDTVVG
jgi:hypothetical protein